VYDALRRTHKIAILLFTQSRRTVAYTRSCYHSRTGIRVYRQQPRAACVIIHWNTFTISIERKCDCILWIFKDIFEYRCIVIFYTHFHAKELSILINSNITCPLFYRIARTQSDTRIVELSD